ncbi:hypothetical protein U737_21350 [Methylomonas sp. LW13]|uniref:hypothetical protein n=1 Tax=unclassified Methylomonas TaxID=2608980 RepID=UPI00068E0C82|nr:hypothetical protein [Methylomonas sp. LW13]QBC29252.1 hypothetical protein U737_21350 [Methylomonas sp. LW13]
MIKQKTPTLIYLPCLILVMMLAGIESGRTEPKPVTPGGEAIKKAQGMIRQLSQEKYALEAEKTAWLAEKAALDTKLKNLEAAVSRLQALQAEVERYKSGLETVRSNLEAQLGQQRQREQALLQKHNEVVGKARDIREDNRLLVQAVKEREQWIEQCTGVNQQLRTINLEVLKQYKDKSLLQQLAELDPLTGIGQVQTETVAEEYRYKLQQLKITPFEATQPVVMSNTRANGGAEPVEPSTLVPDAGGIQDDQSPANRNASGVAH